ncbi:MAG TPA: glycosyltransferase family 4 protein [Chitinophagales bacterium]|jgi:glycosyltransferase involved in cell wall biosynthesis|nr:glycosyltransferase family 4 protein [Chitinophagales bacterium]HQW79532.1 glycosyltransferase family 4 protein [Chitinophagales bacterium]HRB18627.1 glycosyltransferase family 4 protein [Chitinophagales bacterium]HRB66509.1 glycosyltransferase family 4 protein [Chitinophagales bacterium]HRB69211.1 glycosyltransferase family 4 protein [Chitinophagales bacterium]
MKKILFLTPTLPYPPVSGGVIKSNKVIHFLTSKYEVAIACFLKNEDKKYVQEFQKIVSIENFITEELEINRNIKNLILSNLQGIPLNLYRNKSVSFKAKIDACILQYDTIFCDHYVMFQYIPETYKGKIILHQHNCEYLIWQRYAAIEKNLLKKFALLNQAHRIKNYEQAICRRSDVILAAPNDTDELVRIGASRNKFLETYHLGDDALLNEPDLQIDNAENNLLYIGTLSWEANIDGLIWFCQEVWPLVKNKHPETKLSIVGKHPDTRLQNLAAKDSKIILTGFIENLEPYFQKNKVFITPLRFGSGIKVKVINALYRGIPCVTTSIGTEGLKAKDGEHLFCKDDAQAFSDAIICLFSDNEKWKTMSLNARELARQHYTWEAVLENIRIAVEQ